MVLDGEDVSVLSAVSDSTRIEAIQEAMQAATRSASGSVKKTPTTADMENTIEAKRAEIAKLEAKRAEAETEIKGLEEKLRRMERAGSKPKTKSLIAETKADLHAARARATNAQRTIDSYQRLIDSLQKRLENP